MDRKQRTSTLRIIIFAITIDEGQATERDTRSVGLFAASSNRNGAARESDARRDRWGHG